MILMKLKNVGELQLIDRIKQKVDSRGKTQSTSVVIGIGDDGAILRLPEGLQVVTTDTIVEDIHFSRSFGSWEDIGWKAMASNLSDIAAMAGNPNYSLVTLGLPPEMELESVEKLYDGLLDCVDKFGGAVIGGDIVSSDKVFVTITVFGNVDGPLCCRANAKVGDSIAVTGCLGGPAAALKIVQLGLEDFNGGITSLAETHMRITPRVSEAKLLAQRGVICSMDISDGLKNDLGKLCKASDVSALLVAEQIPVHPLAMQAFPNEFLDFAVSGGEDYELVLTASSELLASISSEFPNLVTIIGRIGSSSEDAVSIFDKNGAPLNFISGGWNHFLS